VCLSLRQHLPPSLSYPPPAWRLCRLGERHSLHLRWRARLLGHPGTVRQMRMPAAFTHSFKRTAQHKEKLTRRSRYQRRHQHDCRNSTRTDDRYVDRELAGRTSTTPDALGVGLLTAVLVGDGAGDSLAVGVSEVEEVWDMVGDADGAGVRVTVGLGDGSMRRCHTCTQGGDGLQVHAQLNRWSHLQARISHHTGLHATSFMAYGTLSPLHVRGGKQTPRLSTTTKAKPRHFPPCFTRWGNHHS
jgi:hypothetical protein